MFFFPAELFTSQGKGGMDAMLRYMYTHTICHKSCMNVHS